MSQKSLITVTIGTTVSSTTWTLLGAVCERRLN